MRSVVFDKSMPRVLATLGLKKVWHGAIHGPWAPVRLVEEPRPELPGPRGVRVRPKSCGICATDLHFLDVDVDPMIHYAALPSYDRVYLGHEAVGEVVEAGPAASLLTVGQRVLTKVGMLGPHCGSLEQEPPCPQCAAGNYALCFHKLDDRAPRTRGGGWSDELVCHETDLWPVPDWLDDERAMLSEPLACGVRAALRRTPAPGERALVIGCGIIGLGTVQGVRAAAPEAHVYASARYPHQAALAEAYGAEVLQGDLFEAGARATGATLCRGEFGNRTLEGGFDVVYDCVGNGDTLQQALRLARTGGAVVMVGLHLHRVKTDLTPLLGEVDLIGSCAHGGETWQGESLSTFDLTARWIREGKLSTEGLLTHRFGLSAWRDAVRTATDKRTGAIKVALDCRR